MAPFDVGNQELKGKDRREFWAFTVVFGFEGEAYEDFDPNDEPGTLGITQKSVGGLFHSFSVVYLESNRDGAFIAEVPPNFMIPLAVPNGIIWADLLYVWARDRACSWWARRVRGSQGGRFDASGIEQNTSDIRTRNIAASAANHAMDALRKCRIALLCVLCGAALTSVSGCGKKTQELRELEAEGAGAIYRALDLYEALNPTTEVTNLPQVFNATQLGRWHVLHPARFDREFRKFGKYAGFTNSFYEKYVRVPATVTNRAFPTEARFMNAQPVPDYDGRFGRYVIWREGPQYHRSSWVPEDQIQEAFRRAGVAIPKPTPMPKPPVPEGRPYSGPPLSTRVRLFFRDLVGPAFADELMWICFGVPIAGAVVVVWFVRRRSH